MSLSARVEAARSLAAAPSTIMGLHLRLKERLQVVADRFPLMPTKSGETRAPVIFDGWVPPKTNTGELADEQFPFFAVRPKSGTDTVQGADENGTATVEIWIGTFADDDDGWLDVLILIDAIRADLGMAPTIEGTAFEQVGPLTWQLLDQQPRPQWFGTVTTIWQMPRPQRVEARNPEG